jgi:hypothetical protein
LAPIPAGLRASQPASAPKASRATSPDRLGRCATTRSCPATGCFRTWTPAPHNRPGQFPAAETLVHRTLKLPVPQHDDADLVESYLDAFAKVWHHRTGLPELKENTL